MAVTELLILIMFIRIGGLISFPLFGTGGNDKGALFQIDKIVAL
mgnify:CR=1 FL=1